MKPQYIKSESPDFLFSTVHKEMVGLEVTNFIVTTDHGKALQHLKGTSSKLIAYTKDKYQLDISITISYYERKKEELIDNNIEKLKAFPKIVRSTIEVDGEFLRVKLSGFPNIDNAYDCTVLNSSMLKENPIEELQLSIDKKNANYERIKISVRNVHC